MISSYEVIKALIRSEKATQYEPEGKYLFLVNNDANKIQIKRAVEEIYKVKVRQVNIFNLLGKMRRVRHQLGRMPNQKKAVVTLKQGEKIDTAV